MNQVSAASREKGVMGGQTADTILLGNVLVLDRAGSTAEAIAIAGGRILGTGRRDAVMELRGPGTQVHDFGASTLIPASTTHTPIPTASD